MKHLSHVPEPPSSIRSEIPHDLDLVVLRALAKDPADRYRSAAEMDRDLELVARGDAVGKETADAATMVLSGARDATALDAGDAPAGGRRRRRASATAPTTRRSRRGRSIWPWLLGLGRRRSALAAGGYFAYQKIQDQLDKSKPVRVEQYTGIKVENAQGARHEARLRAAGRAGAERRRPGRHRLQAGSDRGHEPRTRLAGHADASRPGSRRCPYRAWSASRWRTPSRRWPA